MKIPVSSLSEHYKIILRFPLEILFIVLQNTLKQNIEQKLLKQAILSDIIFIHGRKALIKMLLEKLQSS